MKTKFYCVICVLSLFTPIYLRAQDTIGPLEFFAIISADGKSQSQLFTLSKAWFVETFAQGATVNNNSEDLTGGVFIGRVTKEYMFHKRHSAFTMTGRCTGNVFYTLKIQVKDGRIKLSSSNFTHEGIIYSLPGGSLIRYSLGQITNSEFGDSEWPRYKKECWTDVKSQIEEEFNRLKISLESYIQKSNEQDETW